MREGQAVLGGPLQPHREPVAGGGEVLALPVRQLRRVRPRPGHEDRAVRLRLRRHRQRGEREGVGEDHGDPGVVAGHLLPAAHPHQPAFAHRVGHGDRRAQRDPLPRRGEGAGQPRHHGHLQHGLIGERRYTAPEWACTSSISAASVSDSSGRPTGARVPADACPSDTPTTSSRGPHPISPVGGRPARRTGRPVRASVRLPRSAPVSPLVGPGGPRPRAPDGGGARGGAPADVRVASAVHGRGHAHREPGADPA